MELALADLDFIKKLMWKDLSDNTESFNYKFRLIDRLDVILSSFYDYETSHEMDLYKCEMVGKIGKAFADFLLPFSL